MNENIENKKENFLNSDKFIRDLVLDYVYLTKFDLKIIDTIAFQRLKDVRQLTSQHVFPSARHTRFEHSLGVMELTRQAIRALNKNGFLSESDLENTPVINEQLEFNAALAALLHDVGHCPFSHLGESELSSKQIWSRLCKAIRECYNVDINLDEEYDEDSVDFSDDLEFVKMLKFERKREGKGPGAKHEQMSCIVILEKYGKIFKDVKKMAINLGDSEFLFVDFELIIRSILGVRYDVSTPEKFYENKEKNVIVSLINLKIFDMDKLDYIMRDSFYTGIGTPKIDTRRLFQNMYLNSRNEYKIVFTNRAVPALQNMIESRDELYMYVYNHHTAVFSDFMSSYIFRRLAHNADDFFQVIQLFINPQKTEQKNLEEIDMYDPITHLGTVSKDYLFSTQSIIEQNRSDSDLISLLNIIHYDLSKDMVKDDSGEIKFNNNILFDMCKGYIKEQLIYSGNAIDEKNLDSKCKKYQNQILYLCNNVNRIYNLVDKFLKREYLKPWWKTNSEFSNFINTNFRDDRIREKLCNWICEGEGELVQSDEFRSQLAKNVTFITQHLFEDYKNGSKGLDLIKPFKSEEFFVIQRSARFFDPKTISELDIALKSNEILGSPNEVKYCIGDFYFKDMTSVIPQRHYYSMYVKNSFYVFSKPFNNEDNEYKNPIELNRHYRFIERIFVFVATKLISDGARAFYSNYGSNNKKTENDSHINIYHSFLENNGFQVKSKKQVPHN